MMLNNFREYAHEFVDWMADYLENVESFPVKSQVQPGQIYNQIAGEIPPEGERMETIFEDFKKIILPGITHWQSPNFFAYFQGNSSPPSVLAEMLTATLAIQGMKWDTSPASTELEERMMQWLGKAIGIPASWSGVIQDSASLATLTSIVTAREQKSGYQINEAGYDGFTRLRLYCSTETHSSIEKGARIAGIGKKNVVKIPADENLALRPDLLQQQLDQDLKEGYQPLCIVAAIGTTGTMAIDPLEELMQIADQYKVWLHIDAAYAGSALILPEYRHLIAGIEKADSFVFNPHKWLFTNFDCSAYFVKDKRALLNTFTILPEYLKSQSDSAVNNHCDWGIQLGRRFRSLKLWFVLRNYGLQGLQQKLREHIQWAEWLEKELINSPDFEIVVPRHLNMVCFRYCPSKVTDKDTLNALNEELLRQLNATGKLYLTHTRVQGTFTLRMVIGQTSVTRSHVEKAWQLIQEIAVHPG